MKHPGVVPQGIANRVCKLRLYGASEQAWSQILRTACAAGFPSQHDTSLLMKGEVKRGDKGAPHDVVECPVHPKDLPFYDSAYEGEELAKVDEERILSTAVSLRKTNKEAKAHRSLQLGMDAPSGAQSEGLSKGLSKD